MAGKKSNPQKEKINSREVPEELKIYARLLDSRFSVGKFRFGIDPVIGLIPGVGDFASLLLSGGLIALASKYGASGKLMVLMSLNALLDAIIGSIPFIGGIFDFFYKANNRNVRLLEKHYRHGKHQGSGKGLVVIIILTLIAIAVLFIYLTWEVLTYLLELI